MIEPRRNTIKPIRQENESLVDFAHRMALYYEEVRYGALQDIRAIDKANARSLSSSRIVPKPICTRETERERISVHEKAQSNPLLREILRKMVIKW